MHAVCVADSCVSSAISFTAGIVARSGGYPWETKRKKKTKSNLNRPFLTRVLSSCHDVISFRLGDMVN